MNNQLKIRLVKYYIYSYFLNHLQKITRTKTSKDTRAKEREREMFLKDSMKK